MSTGWRATVRTVPPELVTLPGDTLTLRAGVQGSYLHLADDQHWAVTELAYELVDVDIRLPQLWARAVPAHNLLPSCCAQKGVGLTPHGLGRARLPPCVSLLPEDVHFSLPLTFLNILYICSRYE